MSSTNRVSTRANPASNGTPAQPRRQPPASERNIPPVVQNQPVPQQQPQPPVPPAPQAMVAAPTLNFALTPGVSNIATPLDYSTKSGVMNYQRGTEPLTVKFDGEVGSLNTFIERLSDRAIEMGWGHTYANILDIPTTVGGTVTTYNLLQEFGRLKLQDVTAHANNSWITQQTRAAQNAVMMYYCIMASLTDDANIKILTETDKFTLQGIPDGPSLFKYLVDVVNIDTRATVTHIRTNLSNLDIQVSALNFDIEKFNLYVKEQRKQLQSRGERSDDILINLFKAYNNVPDKIFVNYILRKKESYEEGAEITVDSLMADALNRFQALKSEGRWKVESPEDKSYIALQTELAEFKSLLKKNKLKLSDSDLPKSRKIKKNEKSKASGFKTKSKKLDDKWRKTPPKDDDSKTKSVKGKIYHWCIHHMAWVRHKPEDCNLMKQRNQGGDAQTPGQALAQSYAAIVLNDE